MEFNILNNFLESTLLTDKKSAITFCNQSFYQEFNYSSSILGDELKTLIPNFLVDAQNNQKEITIKDNQTITIINGNGKNVEVLITKSIFEKEYFKYTFIPTNHLNPFKNEEMMKMEMYLSLIEHNIDHLFQLDENLDILYINHVAPGLVKEEVIGTSILNYLPNEASMKIVKEALKLVRKTKEGTRYVVDFDSPLGKMYFDTTVTPVIKDNKVFRYNLITRNISDDYYNKAALAHKSKFVEKISKNNLAGIYIFNVRKSKNLYSNERCQDILGFKNEEFKNMSGRKFINHIHPDDREKVMNHWQKLIDATSKESFVVDYRFKSKSEGYKWLRSRDSNFEYDDKGELESIIGSFVDITDIVELQNTKNELQKKNQEIEDFVYSASHDIKSPINNVAQLIDFSISKGDLNGPEIEVINKAVQRLNNLVIDVLDYGKSKELGVLEEVDLNKVFDNVKEDLKTEIDESKVNIEINISPTKVMTYYFGLYRIFLNLIGNAIKFRDKTKSLEIKISGFEKGDFWEFTCEDNGIGIHEKSFDKIFEPFVKLHNADVYAGSGLGLSNCKKIVQYLKGDIYATNSDMGGAKFTFTISKDFFIEKKRDTNNSASSV
ncbi:PAS domain-containing protein [Flammeovirga yaeyamensis]|uniref:histidine kinase n=1 Tax=Flammeovirga yaeyamensis TaxID=367791 RepID=A0AAX1MZT8_9BACT|nr:ATP-binding protein [Flammeovirga yaeyamensis]MBB3700290.1 PAS domain S-box-containing protein [Flammeovirga yaeyamensis]NMF37084.1 PAS domain-containing protein [Flammeovirga yaeyamensis]QWG00775.1 PAS domain-containing protein [Flammeovirga yaeyamensis]